MTLFQSPPAFCTQTNPFSFLFSLPHPGLRPHRHIPALLQKPPNICLCLKTLFSSVHSLSCSHVHDSVTQGWSPPLGHPSEISHCLRTNLHVFVLAFLIDSPLQSYHLSVAPHLRKKTPSTASYLGLSSMVLAVWDGLHSTLSLSLWKHSSSFKSQFTCCIICEAFPEPGSSFSLLYIPRAYLLDRR